LSRQHRRISFSGLALRPSPDLLRSPAGRRLLALLDTIAAAELPHRRGTIGLIGMPRTTQFDTSDNRHEMSRRSLVRPGVALALVLFAAGAGIGAYRLIAGQSLERAHAPAAVSQKSVPNLVRDGSRIVVPEGSPLRGKLTIGTVTQQQIDRTLQLPAIVEAEPARTVKVLPPVAGRLIDLKIQLGERVERGQELAVIDSSDLAQAYADEDKARSAVKMTKQALDRAVALEKYSAGSVKDRQQAENDHAQAQAELERTQSRLRAIGVVADLKEEGRKLSLKAPVSGSVIDLQVARGAHLNDTTAAIMTIANLDEIWVTANVPEKDTALVAQGQAVDVVFAAYPGEVFKGRVLFVSDILDPDTRRTKVRIAFQNPNMRLKPNMFASATFVTPKQTVPIVPTTAVVLRNEADQVFVEIAPWTFEARPIEIDFQQGNQAVIAHGLEAGQRVVVRGAVLLND
jgi:cobalt-zinc-cadmium efflux system membrane fusion protein